MSCLSMTYSEFDLIRHFFTEQSIQRADVPLGIGVRVYIFR